MVRVIVLVLIALGWWLAAPDRFTAAARTASGTGLRAAGTGAKAHWDGGRDGRALGRTKRRDRWHAKGGWWRKLLGLEHGAVITGKAVKGASKLAGAAVKPIPGAVRDGWRKGQDRHRARTAGRPVPVALDPPWWRKPDPAPVPDETGQDSPRDSGAASEDSPDVIPGQPQDEAAGATDAEPPQPAQTPFFPDAPDGPVLDSEADIRGRNPELALIQPGPLTEGQRRFWHLRDRGYPGALDQDGWPAPDVRTGAIVNPMPYLRQSPGTSQAETATPTDTPGGTVPISTELRTHVAVQDFAHQIDRISEASDFIVVAEKAREVGKQSRAGGFGGEMDLAVDSLEAAAKRFAQDVDTLREQAHALTKTSLSVQGA